ncbi:MAG: MFS transporter [Desulfobacterales bacterium]|nr:MFS transporter [Desulfobacterales bacterium]
MAGITGLFFPVIAGAVSDRINTPLGRRRPLIITGWILACIMVGLLMRIDSLLAALPVIMLAYAGFFLAIGPYFALLPDTVPAAQRSFASGVMFLIGGTGMLSYLMFAARLWETSHTRPFVWVVIAVAVSVTVMCFSVREARVPVRLKQPSLLRELLRRKNVLKFFAAMTLQWIGLWMLSAFFVIANMALFGLSVERAIEAFFVMNVSFVLFALPAGLLATKLGLKRTTIYGMAIMIVSFCCVSFVKSYSALIVLMVISGVGYGTVLAVSYPFFLSLLPEEYRRICRILSCLSERNTAHRSGRWGNYGRPFRVHDPFLWGSRGHAGGAHHLHYRTQSRRAREELTWDPRISEVYLGG